MTRDVRRTSWHVLPVFGPIICLCMYELVFGRFCQHAATLRVAYQANPSMPGGRRLVEHTQETHPDGGDRLSRPYTHTVPHKQPTAPTCEHPRERGYGSRDGLVRCTHAI